MADFLPVSKEDMKKRGVDRFDFICVTGDAYVDHPSFGIAIISRLVESFGFTVGMLAQPDYNDLNAFKELSEPKYAFLVTGGNIDSMVSNYTVAKKRRGQDAYSPGNKTGKRPDRAVTVYCRMLKKAYPKTPVIIGGLEASLRRFAHYDYWSDKVMPSVLVDSGADLLMYGMGERGIKEITRRLADGESIEKLTDIKGTCYLTDPENTPFGAVQCADYDIVSKNKEAYAKACLKQLGEQDEVYGKTVVQRQGDKMLVQNPPMPAISSEMFDYTYELEYMRMYHPMYEPLGGVDAIKEVEFSITHNRGCFGNCNFCSIALHQGRKISVRSEDSVVREAEGFTKNPRFKGYIHDVGGPTANFRHPSCDKQETQGLCRNKKCLAPEPCPNLNASHDDYLNLLYRLRKIKGVKRIFIRSGIRYDYLLAEKKQTFLKELIKNHVSGQLKVAPEHCSNAVLDNMGKPHIEVYEEFSKKFYEMTKSVGKEQYLVPYLMSSHPGCTLKDAVDLALFLKKHGIRPEQVQDFYPTPGTVSTCMFYTGINPYTMQKVYVAKSPHEKAMQRALMQYFLPKNHDLVIEALCAAGRRDLIGNGKNCLVAPNRQYLQKYGKTNGGEGKGNKTKWQKGKAKRK